MKAIIGGVTVEGTPQEVWDFLQKQQAAGINLKPVQPMPDWFKRVSGDVTLKCPNKQCYCTGECMGKGKTSPAGWAKDIYSGNELYSVNV